MASIKSLELGLGPNRPTGGHDFEAVDRDLSSELKSGVARVTWSKTCV